MLSFLSISFRTNLPRILFLKTSFRKLKICIYLHALDHATSFRNLFNTMVRHTDYRYVPKCYTSGRQCLIQLAQFHLRSCVTFEGTHGDCAVDSESIAKAEQYLGKVLDRWEGICCKTEGKYLLAMSDLHLRKKQYHKALKFASEALELCSKRNQLQIAEWAERRIVYLER